MSVNIHTVSVILNMQIRGTLLYLLRQKNGGFFKCYTLYFCTAVAVR